MDLEKRLNCAQMLNGLIKRDELLTWKTAKLDPELVAVIEGYVKRQLSNLLLKVMGEQTDDAFNAEEMAILKQVAARIRSSQPDTGAKA